MKKLIIFCLLSLALNSTAYGAQLSKIELADGSIINGEIVSYLNNVYTINTAAFGEIKIKADRVSKIELADYSLANTTNNSAVQTNNLVQSSLDTYKDTLMKNPENIAIFKGLASDFGVQEIAKDTQIQDAVKTGNIQSLLNNPKFMSIVNNPEIQAAVKKLKRE